MSYLGTVPIRVRFVRRSFTKADHKGCIPLLIAKGGGGEIMGKQLNMRHPQMLQMMILTQ